MTGVFPGGWQKGDVCYLITSKAKRIAVAHTVESFDGRYFGVRGNSGLFHHVSPGRMFRSKADAVASLGRANAPAKNEVCER